MIRDLTLGEVLVLHAEILARSRGLPGIRDLGALESALAQPQMTFAGEDLYSGLGEKAAALGYFLVSNHPFNDGNKRIGHAVMETFLVLNGWELAPDVDEQERVILSLAAGHSNREDFTAWVTSSLRRR